MTRVQWFTLWRSDGSALWATAEMEVTDRVGSAEERVWGPKGLQTAVRDWTEGEGAAYCVG